MSDPQVEPEQITLIVVSHTHWDREWWGTYQVFRMKLVRLIDKLLHIFAREPEYAYFTLDGQTIVLEDYLEVRPERETELAELIFDGRLLVGPWYILPDEFLVSGESIIRNLQRGTAIAARYGAPMPVGYIPDPFGHISQAPQILRGFGIGWAVFWRGTGESVKSTEFLWHSPDGSTVLATRLPMGYSNGLPLNLSLSAARWQVSLVRRELEDIRSTSTILLLNGDDHAEPSRDLPGILAELNAELAGENVRLVHGTLPQYRAAVVEQLTERAKAEEHPSPESLGIASHMGEFREAHYAPLLPGVLSTRIWIKQAMHACENLLERELEPWEAWHWALTRQYGGGDWERDLRIDSAASLRTTAWKYLLQNQPHDSVCGCAIDLVHDEMKTRFASVEQLGGRLRDEALQGVGALLNTAALERAGVAARQALVVWNPLAQTRSDVVVAKFDLGAAAKDFALYDDDGQQVPHEIIERQTSDVATFDLPAAAVEGVLAMAGEGRVLDLVVLDVNLRRDEHSGVVDVDIMVADVGEPNLVAIQSAADVARKLVATGQAALFRLRAYRAERVTARFLARAVPGLGYRTYLVAPDYGTPAAAAAAASEPLHEDDVPRPAAMFQPSFGSATPPAMHPAVQTTVQAGAEEHYSIENEFLRVEADPATGLLLITDLKTGLEIIGNRFVDVGDAGDEYNHCPPPNDTRYEGFSFKPRLAAIEDACGSAFVIEGDLELPAWLSEDRQGRSAALARNAVRSVVRLPAGAPRVDISTTIDNRSGDHWLRVAFDVPLQTDHSFAEGSFDVVYRPIDPPQDTAGWSEQPTTTKPQKGFCGVADAKKGVLLANRGLPEFEVTRREDGVTLALTLLRCVGWLSRDDLSTRPRHAGPGLPTPGAQLFGVHTFDYSLVPFGGSWLDSRAYQAAQSFSSPLYGSAAALQAGALPPSASLIAIDAPELVASAFKRSEDGESLILRAWNIGERPIESRIALPAFVKAVRLARLDEQPLERLHAEPENRPAGPVRIVKVKAGPKEIVTLRLDI